MPDGDIIRLGFEGNKKFYGAYRQLCEDVPPEYLAQEIVDKLSKHIKQYGPGPRDLLKNFLPDIIALSQQKEPVTPQQVDQFEQKIISSSKQMEGKRQGFDIAKDTCTKILQDISQRQIESSDIPYILSRSFIDQVLENTFDGPIETLKEHLYNTPPDVIQERRQELQPHLEGKLDNFAKQLLRNDSNKKLRNTPTRRTKKAIEPSDIIE